MEKVKEASQEIEEDIALRQRPRLREACIKLKQMAQELSPGTKLPTMFELRELLGMSYSTLSDAVKELERRGILRSVAGVGVYVEDGPQPVAARKLGILFRHGRFIHPYNTDLLSGIQYEAAKHNLKVILLDETTNSLAPKEVDALLLSCHETEALIMDLPSGLPHVMLFRHSPDFTCIAADDFEGFRRLTEHLLEQGHRRIICLLSSNTDTVSLQRLAGYRAAHAQTGVPVDNNCIRFLDRRSHANYREAGEAAMRSLLEGDWESLNCTAIMAHNDDTAIGVVKQLTKAGLSVPQQVSVTGFDGTEISEMCTPSLTTVKIPLKAIGERAIKVLLEGLQGNESHLQKVVLPVRLKLGESTAPYRS